MNDPERLLHGSPDGLSARLLRAGADEAPAPRSLERTLAALGAASTALGAAGTAGALGASSTAGALGAAGTGKVVATLTLVSLAKWAGVGVASGVLVSVAAHVVARAPEPNAQPIAAAASSAEVRSAPPTEHRAPAQVLPSPLPEASVTAEARTSTPAAAPTHAVDERAGAPLAAEVTFVDRGRALFQRGDGAGALAVLADYEQTFPERRLLPEVLYLRMEALSLAGERARASDIARRIVRNYGKGPHAARARAVLANP
ncbi:MAG TPA: hypothetical protein VNN72_08360 [Polyangiaceae bacterium]|nr:hypothetical protein [Polyangiaceae bacterium]